MVIVREWTNNNISIICVFILKKSMCLSSVHYLRILPCSHQAAKAMAYIGLTPFQRNKLSKILFEFTGICNNHVFALIGFQWLLTAVLWAKSQTVSLLHAAIACFESDKARRGEKLFWKRLSSISSRTRRLVFFFSLSPWLSALRDSEKHNPSLVTCGLTFTVTAHDTSRATYVARRKTRKM